MVETQFFKSDREQDVLQNLFALEEKLALISKGINLPSDPDLTKYVSEVLINKYPRSDLQIIVSSSRKTTTAKQCYETETPGMMGLDIEELQKLQKQLMIKICQPNFDSNTNVDKHDFKDETAQNGGTDPSDAVQHKSTVEEGHANEDGSLVTLKKLTRVVTTSHSSISGIDNNYSSSKDNAHDGLLQKIQESKNEDYMFNNNNNKQKNHQTLYLDQQNNEKNYYNTNAKNQFNRQHENLIQIRRVE